MRKRVFSASLLALIAAALWPAVCLAQVGVTPFFFPGSVGFEATISTVSSGPFLAQRAIISADQKYVTIDANYSNTGLAALIPYTFVNLPNGFAGQATPAVVPGARHGAAGAKPVAVPAGPPTILDKTGMTFVAPLKN